MSSSRGRRIAERETAGDRESSDGSPFRRADAASWRRFDKRPRQRGKRRKTYPFSLGLAAAPGTHCVGFPARRRLPGLSQSNAVRLTRDGFIIYRASRKSKPPAPEPPSTPRQPFTDRVVRVCRRSDEATRKQRDPVSDDPYRTVREQFISQFLSLYTGRFITGNREIAV